MSAGRLTPKFVSKLVSKITTHSPSTAGGGGGAGTYNTRYGTHSETSLEAFGRSLENTSGRGKQKSACVRTQSSFDVEMIDMQRMGNAERNSPPSGRIHVLTAIDQEVEVERKGDSDCESTRDLVRGKGYV